MLQRLSLAILSSLFVGCASIPPKPDIDLCIVDINNSQLICAPTTDQANPSVMDYRQILSFVLNNERKTRIPLEESGGYIAMSPDHWGVTTVYMKELRAIAERKCSE